MDRLTALPRGMQLMLVGGALLLIDSFFHWQSVDLGPLTVSRNAWHGWGFLMAVLTIALLAWLIARIAASDVEMPISDSTAGTVLAALIVLSTLLKVLVDNEFRTGAAWIGLVFAILIAVGAWLQMKAGNMEPARTEAPMPPPQAPPPPPSSEPAGTPPPAGEDVSAP